MSTRFTDKDPADIIALKFDFSVHGSAVTNPVLTIAVAVGEDPAAAAMLLDAPTISGASVIQRVQAGVNGADYAIECTADVGVQRITVAGILPVRDRPIIAAATPVYLTEAAFERRFGAEELRGLLADGASFVAAENEAASLIDGYLARRYALPLAETPTMVLGWAADITRYKLWAERAPDEVRRRYEDAMRQLGALARNQIVLPPTSAGEIPDRSGTAFGAYTTERIFTMSSLSEF